MHFCTDESIYCISLFSEVYILTCSVQFPYGDIDDMIFADEEWHHSER